MKYLFLIILTTGLLACTTAPRKQVIEDPLSPKGFTNYLIYNGTEQPDILLEDPLSPKDFHNYLLFEGEKK